MLALFFQQSSAEKEGAYINIITKKNGNMDGGVKNFFCIFRNMQRLSGLRLKIFFSFFETVCRVSRPLSERGGRGADGVCHGEVIVRVDVSGCQKVPDRGRWIIAVGANPR